MKLHPFRIVSHRVFLGILVQSVVALNIFAQVFSDHLPIKAISAPEFNILFGEPIALKGEVSFDGVDAVEELSKGEHLEQGFVRAKLKVSEIVYAPPQILENLGFLSLDEGVYETLTLDVFLLVSRPLGDENWNPDWSRLEIPKVVVIGRSSILGFYYIDSMNQCSEVDLLLWLERRIALLDKWNSGSSERLAKIKNSAP
jgi:hypothetical protein